MLLKKGVVICAIISGAVVLIFTTSIMGMIGGIIIAVFGILSSMYDTSKEKYSIEMEFEAKRLALNSEYKLANTRLSNEQFILMEQLSGRYKSTTNTG